MTAKDEDKKPIDEYDELTEKIMRGLDIVHERLIETKRRNNGVLVVLDENNQIVKIKLSSDKPLPEILLKDSKKAKPNV
jgi:hypothetical protein